MKTIVLTEKEHKKLYWFLLNVLSPDSWLGSKFLNEESSETERKQLHRILEKLTEKKVHE